MHGRRIAMAGDIVCQGNVQRHYGSDPVTLAKYEAITRTGHCPFCFSHIENEVVVETVYWVVVKNQIPYLGSRLHLLVLPKLHRISLSELNSDEWEDLQNVIRLAKDKYPFLNDGYGFAVREKEVGGVTLYHVHFHIIAPEIGENGQIPVQFGIG